MRRLAFLVYDPRSGSTLLSSLMNSMNGVLVCPETQFVSRVLEVGIRRFKNMQPNHILKFLNEESHFREIGIPDHILLKQLTLGRLDPSISSVILAVVGAYEQTVGEMPHLIVIKGDQALFHAREILKAFPEAMFIHLVRDGRAVYASKRNTISTEGRVFVCSAIKAAQDWVKNIRLAEELGDHVRDVQYEALIEDPEGTIKNLAERLGLSDEASHMVKSTAVYASRIGKSQRHLHERVGSVADKSRRIVWKTTLQERDIFLYEAIAGKVLRAQGYELAARTTTDAQFGKIKLTIWYVLGVVEYFKERFGNAIRRLTRR